MPSGLYLRTEEHIKHLRVVNIGRHHSSKTKARISETLKGHQVSNETKTKLSGLTPWNKGLTKETNELIRKMSEDKKGKKHSKAHREKISEKMQERKARDGYMNSPKAKEKISRANKGKHLSPKTEFKKNHKVPQEWREISRESGKKFAGEKSPHWQGGKTSLADRIRHSFKYRQWRSDVFTRDDFTCQDCGKRGVYVEAHHIEAFSDIIEFNDIKTREQAINCEELWNINNGFTLCKDCHNKTKGV